MVGRNLSSDNKTIPRYDEKFNFSDIHPCTYQYLVANQTNEHSSPVFEVVKYAEKNDIYYSEALDEAIKVTGGGGRQGSVPQIKGSSELLAERLREADKKVAGGAAGFVPEMDLKRIRRAMMSTHQNDEYKLVCAQIAPLFLGHKPKVTIADVKALSDDEKATVAEAVDVAPMKLGVDPTEDSDDSTRDEMDLKDDVEDAEEKEDKTIVQTQSVWGSDSDFVVWMYAKLVNRDNIARQLAQGGDPESLNSYSNLRRAMEESSNEDMLDRRIKSDDVIQFTPEQDSKWDQAKQIVSDYSDTDKALADLVNQMSRLEIIVDDSSSGSGSETRIVDPGVDDDSPLPDDYEFSPDDSPEDVPSTLMAEMES